MANNLVKLALLVDGDNVSATYMPLIEREAAKLGALAVRRIYGQFESGKMKSWLARLDEYELTPVNVSPLTRGKNATDLKLTIEAVDLLHGRGFDGFCIASSDGDFTPLAERIRGSAVACYGFGMKKAPAGYKKAFDRFYECDTMLAAEKKGAARPARVAAAKPVTTAPAETPARGRRPRRTAAPSAPAPTATESPRPLAAARNPPRPAPSVNAAAAKSIAPRAAFLAAVDAAKKDDAGWSHTRDVGHMLKGGYRVKDAIREYPDAVDVDKRGNITFVRAKPA